MSALLPLPEDFIFSFTFLQNEENCPYKAYRLYVVKDIPYQKTPNQTFGIDVHKAFERRINEGTPFKDEFQDYEPLAAAVVKHRLPDLVHVRAEYKLAIDQHERPTDYWGKKGNRPWLRAIVDASIMAPKLQRAHIFDWKTGKVREDPFELQIQAWLLQKYYPGLETFTGSYVWLKDNAVGLPHELSDTERTAASVRAQVAEIGRRGNEWPKRENALCGWCDVLDCEFNRRQPR